MTGDLFDQPGGARRTDPATSHNAASEVKVAPLHLAILNALCVGYATVSEIAEKSSVPRDSLSPRMKALVDAKLVEDTGLTRVPILVKPDPRLRRMQIVWGITQAGREIVKRRA